MCRSRQSCKWVKERSCESDSENDRKSYKARLCALLCQQGLFFSKLYYYAVVFLGPEKSPNMKSFSFAAAVALLSAPLASSHYILNIRELYFVIIVYN